MKRNPSPDEKQDGVASAVALARRAIDLAPHVAEAVAVQPPNDQAAMTAAFNRDPQAYMVLAMATVFARRPVTREGLAIMVATAVDIDLHVTAEKFVARELASAEARVAKAEGRLQ